MGEQDAILVVDPDPDAALLLSDFLEREGYSVVVAATGDDGSAPHPPGALRPRPPRPRPSRRRRHRPHARGRARRGAAGDHRGHGPRDSRLGDPGGREPERRLHREARRPGAARRDRRAACSSGGGWRRTTRGCTPSCAERLGESEALAAISATVSSTLDVREALRRICRELARLLGADTAAAYLHDFGTGRLVPAAAYHVPKEYLDDARPRPPLPLKEQGFFLPLWTDRRPVYSDDVARDERFTHAMFRSFPHQSGLLLPLIVDDEVIGGFYLVWWTDPAPLLRARAPGARSRLRAGRASSCVTPGSTSRRSATGTGSRSSTTCRAGWPPSTTPRRC